MIDQSKAHQPLAWRMAPKHIDEVVGQTHILGEGKLLRRMIMADQLRSIIFYGPPGTGKTSLAKVIAHTTKVGFKAINAVTAGVKDIKEIVQDAQNLFVNPSGRVMLFIDEIHRFNKAQQDALLPYVEDGTIILVGATTENPFFEVNKALISRSTIFQLHPLTEAELDQILERTLTDAENGYGDHPIRLDERARAFLLVAAGGDARRLLNALELAVQTTPFDQDGTIYIDESVAEDCVQQRAVQYDQSGEAHYDVISAFIKSMRGSDPDATIHYLARMLVAGEDIKFIARRIMIAAAEDVGLANPNALIVAQAAYQAVCAVGMPEARIILSEAALLVATSPKSNASYLAINQAMSDVKTKSIGVVPMHLRNAPYQEMEDFGYHVGYKYAHDYPNHYVEQSYLPDELCGTQYYEPTDLGYEQRIQRYLKMIHDYETTPNKAVNDLDSSFSSSDHKADETSCMVTKGRSNL